MSAVKKFSFIKMFPGGGLSVLYFAIALISYLPAAYGQAVVTTITGIASGSTLFAISTNTNLPGYDQVVTAPPENLNPDEDITVVEVALTVSCPEGPEADCLVFSPSIREVEGYFATERSLSTTRDYLNALYVRSTDYLTVSATLTFRVMYRGMPRQGDGIFEELPSVTTYRLVLAEDQPPVLNDESGLEKEGFTTGFKAFSSITVTDDLGDEEVAGVEFTAGVEITANCEEQNNCLRTEPLPSSFTGTTVGEFEAFLREMVVGSVNDRPFTTTLAVGVRVMRGSGVRFSNALEYRLTFVSGAPTLSPTRGEISGDVLRSTPFSSITVTDDPGEADTITSVVVDFECPAGRSTCIGGVIPPIKGTAMQVQSSLRALEVEWAATYQEPRVATATVYLNSSYRTPFGDVVSRRSTPLVYRLSFTISDLPPQLSDASGLDKTRPVDDLEPFTPFAGITLRDDESRGGVESVTGIQIDVSCVGGALVCIDYAGDRPEHFEGGNLQQAEDFLRGLEIRSRFASYSAKLSVSVNTVLRELPRQSNTLVYTLTFPTPGRLRDDRPRLIDPAFARDLGAVASSLVDVVEKVAMHCGNGYFEDSDGDGVPNNVEAQLGTDCWNPDPENVAGGEGRPSVTVDTSDAQVLDELPYAGDLSGLEIQCRGCVEIFFLEKQADCTSASADSVLGNGSIAFPGVNQSSCHQAGYYSSSATAAPSLTGTIFPVPTWSELYVLGIDKYGNWSVSDRALKTKVVYTLPVLSLGPDLYTLGDMANITVEFRGRWTPASSDLLLPTADVLDFTLDVNGTKFPGEFPNPVYRDTMTIPVDVSGIDAGGMLVVRLDGPNSSPPRFAVGRSALTIVKGEAPPFITIGLMEEGNPDPVSVVSLDDEGAGYSLNVRPAGTASTLAITTGDGTVLVSGQTDNLSNLLAQLSDLPGGYAILKVRASLSDNTREAEFPVFEFLENAESGAAWTREVVDRGIVIVGCSPFSCDDDNLAASVNLGQESYLSQFVASSIRGFAASFDRVRETLNGYISGQLPDLDLGSTKLELLTDVISYSGFASNVAQDRASFVLDLRHKPFWVPGRLVKRILVGDDYEWRGVDNFEADGSVSYTLRRDSTCPDPDAEAAWSDTDNGLIPASESTPIRCVRLTIVDGGLYDGDVDGYYADPIFGVSDADFDPSLLAHAGGDGGGSSNSTWIYVLAALAGLLYGGSSGIWMLAALVLVLALSLRRRRVPGVQTRLKL